MSDFVRNLQYDNGHEFVMMFLIIGMPLGVLFPLTPIGTVILFVVNNMSIYYIESKLEPGGTPQCLAMMGLLIFNGMVALLAIHCFKNKTFMKPDQ